MDMKVLTLAGKEKNSISLNDLVFNAEVNNDAIYYAVTNELANKRVGTSSTKTRREVHGTTAKPYAQKGTGRARAGRWKSPTRVGGGIIFGPRPRDFSFNIPKKVKTLAFRSILSMKAKESNIKVVEDFTIESGRTKDLIQALASIVNKERTVIVLKDNDVKIKQAGANLPWVTFLTYNRLRAHDLFYGKNIILLETAALKLNEIYGKN